jgi:hypothetical protein
METAEEVEVQVVDQIMVQQVLELQDKETMVMEVLLAADQAVAAAAQAA